MGDMTWSEYIARSGPLTLPMTLHLLGEVCWRLRRGERVILGEDSLQVSASRGRAYGLRRGGEMASPETLRGAAPGSWTQVYRLAACIFHGVTGSPLAHPLDRAADDTSTREALASSSLSAEERMVLAKALDPDPAARYVSVGDFLDALGEVPSVMLPGDPKKKASPSPRKKRRLGPWVASVAVLLILVVGIGWYAGQRDRYVRALRQLEAYDFLSAAETIASVPDWIGGDVPRIKDLAHAALQLEAGRADQALAQLERLGSFSVAPALRDRAAEAWKASQMQALEKELADRMAKESFASLRKWLVEKLLLQSSGERCEELLTIYRASVEDDPLKLYQALEEATDIPAVEKLRQELIPDIYARGVELFQNNSERSAREYLGAVGDYKKAPQYLAALDSRDPFVLVEYMDHSVLGQRLHETDILEVFLVGRWEGGGYMLTMDEEYMLTTDLPWGDLVAEDYCMTDGLVTQLAGSEEEDSFKITVLDRDTLRVHSFALDKNIKMTRE